MSSSEQTQANLYGIVFCIKVAALLRRWCHADDSLADQVFEIQPACRVASNVWLENIVWSWLASFGGLWNGPAPAQAEAALGLGAGRCVF